MRAALDNLLLAARRSVFYWPFRFTIGFFSPGNWKKGFDKSIEWIDEALALMMFIPLAYGAFIAVSVLVHVLFNTAGVPFLTRLANSGPDWVLSLAESQYTDIAQRARGHLEAVRILLQPLSRSLPLVPLSPTLHSHAGAKICGQ